MNQRLANGGLFVGDNAQVVEFVDLPSENKLHLAS